MAERRGPTDGKRFKRAKPTKGNAKNKAANVSPEGVEINRRTGETFLTPELMARIVSYIEVGNYVETAAACAGISKDTLFKWLKRGARGEEPYVDLVRAVETARAKSAVAAVAKITQIGQTQWQALAWRLERSDPKKWGRRDHLQIAGDEENPLHVTQDKVDLSKYTLEELELIQQLRAKGRIDGPKKGDDDDE